MTYEMLLKLGIKKAVENDKEPEAVKFLLLETFGGDAHQFYMIQKEEADLAVETLFLDRLKAYTHQATPVQHLLGYAYFFGEKFVVNNAVLIPRLETEQLVEHTLYYYDTYMKDLSVSVLDLGCGSGCIGLTLKREAPLIDVTLSDISEDALHVAKENARGLDVDFILSDLFEGIHGAFDIIVSNPPYIPDSEDVMDIVKKEPSVALYGGSLGLDFYEKIMIQAKNHIKSDGLIAFEHGFQQKEPILKLAQTHYQGATIIQMKDLQGKDRFTFIGLGRILG